MKFAIPIKIDIHFERETHMGGARWALHRPDNVNHPVALILLTDEEGCDIPQPLDPKVMWSARNDSDEEHIATYVDVDEAAERTCTIVRDWIMDLCKQAFHDGP
jgi:hypothetical protein